MLIILSLISNLLWNTQTAFPEKKVTLLFQILKTFYAHNELVALSMDHYSLKLIL